MKKTLILTAAFAAFSLASCVKEQEVNGPVTVFSATQADMSTKTVIGAADADGCYQPLWVREDRVKVNGVESRLAVVKEEGKLGFKTGEGFQKWTEEDIQKSRDDLNTYLIRMLYGK